MSEPKPIGKPCDISKGLVVEAYRRVAVNKGAPGVDDVSIEEFERDLSANLYRIWNRLSSGTYVPPPVRAVEIPTAHGPGMRVLGVPTVGDRVAGDGGQAGGGADGGTGVPPRLLRLPAGPSGTGRAGGVPATLLHV